MIFSLEIEQQLLATILQNPDKFHEISGFIGHRDFYTGDSKVHSTLFSVLKSVIEDGVSPDAVLIAEKVKSLGITFKENISIGDYVYSLRMRKTSGDSMEGLARELKTYTVRRDIYSACKRIGSSMKNLPSTTSYQEIVTTADEEFNKQINLFDNSLTSPENIYDEMAALIEDLGENPITDFGYMGPFETVNDIYGSLLRAGNITVITARSAVGKTAFCMNYCTKVAEKYQIPVLHFDNGEMSKHDLIMRQAAALSGVSYRDLETGLWRKRGPEVVEKVRKVWNRVKDLEFYYYNVGGMDVEAMIVVLKRFYYSVVGRGNPMIFSFDYIKTSSEKWGGSNEWEVVGRMVDRFKQAIEQEIVFENEPVISMMTSVQSNRMGITTNKASKDIRDDESIVSLSDRIQHFCSHMFILRDKALDEIVDEGEQFGNKKLICIKARHLGKDIAGHLEPVKIGSSQKKNFINLEFKNFDIVERGDLRDIALYQEAHAELYETPLKEKEEDDVPDLFNRKY